MQEDGLAAMMDVRMSNGRPHGPLHVVAGLKQSDPRALHRGQLSVGGRRDGSAAAGERLREANYLGFFLAEAVRLRVDSRHDVSCRVGRPLWAGGCMLEALLWRLLLAI